MKAVLSAMLALSLGAAACDSRVGADNTTTMAATSTLVTTTTPTTMVPRGEILVVTSPIDEGPGTLRQMLLDAGPGDTILFDSAVFPTSDPKTISVTSGLPQLVVNYLTIDASDAGVIVDGTLLPEDSWTAGLEILSDHNTVRGLQIVNFTGTGIAVAGGRNNTIGGDRSIGQGPVGQGNLTAGNDFGIGIWDSRAAGNVVTGNLVGGDSSGASGFGNANSGVWVTEGATENVIGPDNRITQSGRCGIEIDSSSSLRNTITQNAITESGNRGICLLVGGNARLQSPLVSQLELSSGRVTGTSCPGCRVEVFSHSEGGGATYEGRATADNGGIFSFDKGSAFAGSTISVTATDAGGNTSSFSQPVNTLNDIPTLQEGNRLPMFALVPKATRDLAENRMAATVRAPQLWLEIVHAHERWTDYLLDLGIKRVDVSLNEDEPPLHWDASEFDIPAEFDQLIDLMVANGVSVNYLLHFWDKEGHARGDVLSTPRFTTQEQVDDFIDYVRFIVQHFKGRVRHYTLWTEPDNCGQEEGIKCIEGHDYVELARQVIPVIRQEDPEAKVAVAPVVLFFERDFLPTVMSSDIAPWFDAIQWHGQYGVTPDNEYYATYYYDYLSIVEEIRQVAAAHGFTGESWSTDMTWSSVDDAEGAPEQPWQIPPSERGTDRVAAKYFARGIVAHLGLDISAGLEAGSPALLAPWSYATVRHLSTVMAGASPTDLAVNISSAPTDTPIASYGFRLLEGDMLFALWSDGTAGEDDSEFSVSLAFPGVSVTRAVGFDVLNGFEQELVTETENGDLVIRGLLVKDYPTILRLER